jgi:hypothetical protein
MISREEEKQQRRQERLDREAKEKPKPRARPSREPVSRVSTIVKHINEGKYDDDLMVLTEAIEERQKQRRDKILKLVQQAWGPQAQVIPHPGAVKNEVPPGLGEEDLPIIRQPDGKGLPTDDDLDGEWESRSPIIGPYVPPGAKEE